MPRKIKLTNIRSREWMGEEKEKRKIQFVISHFRFINLTRKRNYNMYLKLK